MLNPFTGCCLRLTPPYGLPGAFSMSETVAAAGAAMNDSSAWILRVIAPSRRMTRISAPSRTLSADHRRRNNWPPHQEHDMAQKE